MKEAHTFDYIIASGIFNVKLNYHHSGWLKQVIETLDKINSLSKKGFSFNLLTTFSQKEKEEINYFTVIQVIYLNIVKKIILGMYHCCMIILFMNLQL